MPRIDYEERLEAKRERLEDRADRLARQAAARSKAGWDALKAIPFGQPILVGHHSEHRDRNYRARAVGNIDKSVALNKAAGEAAARAANLGSNGISSDDPEAVTKLREKLAGLEAAQARMVAGNKIVRALFKAGGPDKPEALAAYLAGMGQIGMGEKAAMALIQPGMVGGMGFASFQLTNNGATIRQTKLRIEQLLREAQRQGGATKVTETNLGVTVVENVEENRVQLIFPGKPDHDTRTMLKSNGFRWSPSEGAWQRLLNNAGRYAARQVIASLTAAA